jgi:Domain of unknown function DUF29
MSQNSVLYDEDFFAWTIEQARLLRAGNLSAIDAANIAEEIESMGRRDRRELRSRLLVLVMHLLKWSKQPGLRSRSWSATIREQRRQIEQILDESPSLRPFLGETLAAVYDDAREDAAAETGLAEDEFPAACPFTADAILSRSFLPEP